ncbi:MAG: NAD(P)-binding protein [Methylococcales bacterium]|nr:NAD(P)-binding protein [Methylococcales bacterium]
MIDNFSHLKNTTEAELATDTCIIGAGAAGITLARALKDTGRDILLLESGGKDFDPHIQDLAAGDSIGMEYYPLARCPAALFWRHHGDLGRALGAAGYHRFSAQALGHAQRLAVRKGYA